MNNCFSKMSIFALIYLRTSIKYFFRSDIKSFFSYMHTLQAICHRSRVHVDGNNPFAQKSLYRISSCFCIAGTTHTAEHIIKFIKLVEGHGMS